MIDPQSPPTPPPFPGASEQGRATPREARAAEPAGRPSVEQVLDEVRGAVSTASKREPYPWLAVASLAFSVIWLLWPEGGSVGAVKLKLWTVFVLTSALMIFTPMIKHLLHLEAFRAWQIAVAGAGGLTFAWVAFLLPSISTNQAFFGTFATAAAALAAWTAPGRPE